MNYLTEINSFYSWIPYNPISANAQALWHYLMSVNNKSIIDINGILYWRKFFTRASPTLMEELQFTNKMQLSRARNELIEEKRIGYIPGKRNRSGTYSMIPFDRKIECCCVGDIDGSNDKTEIWIYRTQKNISASYDAVTNPLPIRYQSEMQNPGDSPDIQKRYDYLKSNIPKEDFNILIEYARQLFNTHFGRDPTIADILFIRDKTHKRNEKQVFNDDYRELLEYAFTQAAMSDRLNIRYVEGVLNKLKGYGIKTADDLAEWEFKKDIEKQDTVTNPLPIRY